MAKWLKQILSHFAFLDLPEGPQEGTERTPAELPERHKKDPRGPQEGPERAPRPWHPEGPSMCHCGGVL